MGSAHPSLSVQFSGLDALTPTGAYLAAGSALSLVAAFVAWKQRSSPCLAHQKRQLYAPGWCVAHLSLVPAESLDHQKVQQVSRVHRPFAPAKVHIVEWSASLQYAHAEPACVWAPCSLQHDEMG